MQDISTKPLKERYLLQNQIGHGGMGTVYSGIDTVLDRKIAIKTLHKIPNMQTQLIARFEREAKSTASLNHPNIITTYDYGYEKDIHFIIMELIDGTNLYKYINARGMLRIDHTLLIIYNIAKGIGTAHKQGIVHRDIKPANILLSREGQIKIADFGIASLYKDPEVTTITVDMIGTPAYLSPEQARNQTISPASDIYSLGVVMYQLLTAQTPFNGSPLALLRQHIEDQPPPPTAINPYIPPELEKIILQCLEKDPKKRFEDGNALEQALATLGENQIRPRTNPKKKTRRRSK
jgi:serine/threonine-protein kinase